MIIRNIFLPAIFILTYNLGVANATKGLASSRRNELDTITPLTERENNFLVTLFNRGIFKFSETSDLEDEPQLTRRRLSSKKSKKSSGGTDSDSRRHAHKLEHTT